MMMNNAEEDLDEEKEEALFAFGHEHHFVWRVRREKRHLRRKKRACGRPRNVLPQIFAEFLVSLKFDIVYYYWQIWAAGALFVANYILFMQLKKRTIYTSNRF